MAGDRGPRSAPGASAGVRRASDSPRSLPADATTDATARRSRDARLGGPGAARRAGRALHPGGSRQVPQSRRLHRSGSSAGASAWHRARSRSWSGLVEVVGGLMLLLGILPRLAALVLIGNMVGALVTAGRVDGGQDIWLPILLIIALAAVLVLLWARGAGRGRRDTGRRPDRMRRGAARRRRPGGCSSSAPDAVAHSIRRRDLAEALESPPQDSRPRVPALDLRGVSEADARRILRRPAVDDHARTPSGHLRPSAPRTAA